MNQKKLIILGLIGIQIVAFFALGLNKYLTWQSLKASQAQFASPAGTIAVAGGGRLFCAYVLVTALSCPARRSR